MSKPQIPADLRRFIYSIESVPHLEALLLLRESALQEWESGAIAKRLYMSQEQVGLVLKDLCAAGLCAQTSSDPMRFIYRPEAEELDRLVGELSSFYSQNLIDVTNIIHSKPGSGQRIRQFADAFKWRKDK